MTQLAPAALALGEARASASLRSDPGARAKLAWCGGLHAPGGRALTKRLVRELETSRSDVLLHLSPAWGRAMDEIMRRPHRPGLRMARVQAERKGRYEGPYTHLREGTPWATGLVAGSVDIVVGQALTTHGHPTERWLAEASRILRSAGHLALHELAAARVGVPHPLETGDEVLTTTGWQRALDGHGFVVEQMWTVPWRWPSNWRLIRDAGLGAWWARRRRLPGARRLMARGEDLLGVAVIARRR